MEELRRANHILQDEIGHFKDTTQRINDESVVRETQLQQTTSNLSRQFEEARAEVRDLRTRVADYEAALKNREREITAASERTRQQGLELTRSAEELGKAKRMLNERELECQAMHERLTGQEQVRHHLESDVDTWRARKEELARQLEDMTRQLEDRVGEIERYQRTICGKDDELEEMRGRAKAQAGQLGGLEANVRSLEKQLQERVEFISYMEGKLTTQDKDLFERTAKCDELARERASLLAQLERLNADLDEAHAETLRAREEERVSREQARADLEEQRRVGSQAKLELSQTRAKVAQLEGKLTTVEDIKADLQSQLRDSETQIVHFQNRITEQRRELTEWGAVIVKLQSEKDELANKLELSEQDRVALEAQANRTQAKNNELREELRLTRETLQKQQEVAARREQEIDLLQRTVDDKQLCITSLDEKCEKHSELLSEKMAEIRALTHQLNEEKSQANATSIELSRVEGRLAAKEEECRTFHDKNVQLRDNAQRMETQLRRLETLPSVVETQEAEIDRMRHAMCRLEDENQAQARGNQTLQQKVNEKEAACSALQMKQTELQMEVQNQNNVREDLQGQLSDKAQEAVRLKGTIARLEGKVGAVEDTNRQWEGRYAQLDQERDEFRRLLDLAADEKAVALRELHLTQDRTAAVEAARDSAERHLHEAQLQVTKLVEESGELRDANQRASLEVNRLRHLEHLPKVVETKEQELARMHDALVRTEAQVDVTNMGARDTSVKCSELETLAAERERQVGNFKRELQQKTLDCEQAMQEVMLKTSENSKLKANLARLEGRLQVLAEASDCDRVKLAVMEDEMRQIKVSESAAGLAVAPAITSTRWAAPRSGSAMSPGLGASASPARVSEPATATSGLAAGAPQHRRVVVSSAMHSPLSVEDINMPGLATASAAALSSPVAGLRMQSKYAVPAAGAYARPAPYSTYGLP
eukprot:TRINITY_DN24787_c0_g1_i1.p1 TRINITY_DN24787_c0_g1~~TRINITY_DN24787_c0_g1_i1.p1  ORF type:complete len:1101 (+),score=457.82 TRINITY_DN24787_c0_g1_i1:477-3305(+)